MIAIIAPSPICQSQGGPTPQRLCIDDNQVQSDDRDAHENTGEGDIAQTRVTSHLAAD
jgi:hypothetical protein